MTKIKLTKNELRAQQKQLGQLQRYLPTLKLKKAMLQSEVDEARREIVALEEVYEKARHVADEYCSLLSAKSTVSPAEATKILQVHKRYENIAGVEVPHYEGVDFAEVEYSLMDTPPWLDGVISGLRHLAIMRAKVSVIQEKKKALEEELRQVAIRVNLFEKILIPRCEVNIKKIKVFLGDQQLAAVGQIKMAKAKIEMHKLRSAQKEEAHAL